MFGLALHTSTPELGLAISDFDTIHRHQTWELGRDLSSQLHVLLGDFLPPQHWQELGFIAVCIGPGGFTGTRIGVAIARTLAQQLDIPLFGISALAAVVHYQLTSDEPLESLTVSGSNPSSQDVAITMPAKRGAVYGAIYSWNGDTLSTTLEGKVLPAQDWALKQEQWPQPLRQLSIAPGVGLAKTTPSLLQLAYMQLQIDDFPDWREVTPFYGQHPVTL